MKNARLVCSIESVNDRQKVSRHCVNISAILDSPAFECSTFTIFAYVVGRILIGRAFNDPQDIRVLKLGSAIGLLLKASSAFRVIRILQSLLNEQFFLRGIISPNKEDFALTSRSQTS
jgi:hypothetical protein